MAELSLVILPSDDCHLTSELISLMIRSTLAQIKAWCHQATSHYLCHCWPTSMASYGIIRPQWLNTWSAANFCENLFPISNDVIWTTKVMQNHWNTRTLGRKYMYLNSTWPGNVVCRHRSINACQVMFVMAPSHCLNQFLHIIIEALCHSLRPISICEMIGLDWISLTTTHVLQDILAVLVWKINL